MNRIEDERVLFFLRHRVQIQEWADLRKEAAALTHRFLESCIDEIRVKAEPGVRVDFTKDGPWKHIKLARPAWFDARGRARAVVSLGWLHNIDLDLAGGSRPFVGADVGEGGSPALKEALREGLRGVIAGGKGWKTGDWPVFRALPAATAAYWDDLAACRAAITEQVLEAWKILASPVDECLRKVVE